MTTSAVITLALDRGYIISQEDAELIANMVEDDTQYAIYLIESQFDFK